MMVIHCWRRLDMFRMCWDITIGNFKLRLLEKVNVKKSVELLVDTAVITIPGAVFNKTIEVENKLKKGDAVTIKLGYNDELKEEFKGYLKDVKTDGGSIILECEDPIYLFRKSVKDEELKNAKVSSILNNVCSQIGGFSVSCDYDFSYDKFVISNATGYDVLKKIQEEASPNIYLKDNVLHVHPQYSEIFGDVVYNFKTNIEKTGTDLKYKSKDDRKLLVVVESTDKSGKTIKVEKGTTGGDKMTVKLSGVTDKASLEAKAQQVLESKVYDGYEGSIQGWLIPFVDAGYKAKIVDDDYEYKNGTYYVISVETDFSQSGGIRKITLGKRLS
jgi:hypothetical protein